MITKDSNSTALILTIHNKQELIRKVIEGLYFNCSYKCQELIIVFDGCSDKSEEIVKEFLEDHDSWWFENEQIKLIYTDDVFETRANNAGLKAVDKSIDYAILVQDDCVITESLFDIHLVKPMIRFSDIWAVSGRNSHNISYSYNYPYILDYPDCAGVNTDDNDRDKFYIRAVVNRGPLAVDMSVMREMNYFSEEIWREFGDDHLLCLNVYKQLGLKCGCYSIGFESKPEWGSTRKPEASQWVTEAIVRNQFLLYNKYQSLIDEGNWWNEERNIS